MTQKRAAGYIRVSSKEQVSGESLTTQTKSIKDYAEMHGYKFTKIYSDKGISGGTVKDRHGLQLCLEDGQQGKFDVLIFLRLSRFGRNAREILQNQNMLDEAGVELLSIKEGIDFSTRYGKAMLGMFSVMAELERDIITEQMLENRIAKGRRGYPVSGSWPIGRTFNKETMQWVLNETVAQELQRAANEYLKGGSLKDIARSISFKISYDSLRKALKDRCGDTWKVNFKDSESLTYKIPRILEEKTIAQIHDRLAFNAAFNRTDIKNKYLLSGFIFCEKCQRALVGQTQKGKYAYYRHSNSIDDTKCIPRPFNQIYAKRIEKAVFQTIFENIVDVPSFEAAIEESLPDEKSRTKLQVDIEQHQKELRRTNLELEKLVNMALEGTLTKETIRKNETRLIEQRDRLQDVLNDKERQFRDMPDINLVKQEAAKIRRLLLEKYSGMQRFDKMTFDEKRELLHWVFEGKSPSGEQYGIYIDKKGKGREALIDYFLYGRITGLRTLKGDNINYFPGEADNPSLSINKAHKRKQTSKYKTKRLSSDRIQGSA